MRLKSPKPLEEATFDLTPMIDVVLLLIIFFMLTSHFAKTQVSPLDLPRERGEPTKEGGEAASVIIDLDRSGRMKILGKPIELEDVRTMIGSDVEHNKLKTDVVVRADRLCPAAHLNRLATTLMGMGLRDWKLATAGPESVGGTPAGQGGGR